MTALPVSQRIQKAHQDCEEYLGACSVQGSPCIFFQKVRKSMFRRFKAK
ncbi:MAG: hypothetical protein RL591_1124 [Planctomycetota bacterium]